MCDVAQAWEYGTVWRASRFPDYWFYNLVRVERRCALSALELVGVADQGLAGLAHRCLDFDTDPGDLRGEFEALGWRSLRLVVMRHEHTAGLAADHEVEKVPYEAVRALRVAWHAEEFPGNDAGAYLEQAAQVARLGSAHVFAVLEDDRPVGFSELKRIGSQGEVASAYVVPERRGRGIGTAVTLAAIRAGRDYDDLFIGADDEDRPKHLYERLGFRAACVSTNFLRLPE